MITNEMYFFQRVKIVTPHGPKGSKQVATKTKPSDLKAKPKKNKSQAIKKRTKSVTPPIR